MGWNMMGWNMMSMAVPWRRNWVMGVMRNMVCCRMRGNVMIKVMYILVSRMWPNMVGRRVMTMV